MKLKTTFDPAKGEKAHQDTILAGPVLPDSMPAPFEHAWGYLDKPGEMEYHKHCKEEVYFFFKGNGFVRIDGEETPVRPGDVVRIPPDSMHTVINREDAELLWAAFWWPVQVKKPEVRVVQISPFRAVTSGADTFDRVMGDFNTWQEAHSHLIRKVICGAPDFLWGEEDGRAQWIWAVEDWVRPEDVTPYQLIDFEGGLYASATSIDGDGESYQSVLHSITRWVESSGFVLDEHAGRRTMCHMLNPSDELHRALGYDQMDIYVPIKIK